MATTIKLSGAQRDSLYGELVLDLNGTGGICINPDSEDYGAARRLRRRFDQEGGDSSVVATDTTIRSAPVARAARASAVTGESRSTPPATRGVGGP